MNTSLIYTSSAIGLQAIDTFDLATTHSVVYTAQVSTNTDIATSVIQVVHNGVITGDNQQGTDRKSVVEGKSEEHGVRREGRKDKQR